MTKSSHLSGYYRIENPESSHFRCLLGALHVNWMSSHPTCRAICFRHSVPTLFLMNGCQVRGEAFAALIGSTLSIAVAVTIYKFITFNEKIYCI